MSGTPDKAPPVWDAWAREQGGVISRAQLLALGMTAGQARADADAGRWQALYRGVYLTHRGPVDDHARLWSALLYAGSDAVACDETALWLAKVVDTAPPVIQVAISTSRRVLPQRGLRIHHRLHLVAAVHPAAQPPRLRLEEALLDVANRAAKVDVPIDLVFRAIQRRLTTAVRLRATMAARSRQRWRKLLETVLTEVATGVQSPLELRYARRVEAAHGLPTGGRNLREDAPSGRGNWYRDVRYPEWRLVVELDGREAHPTDLAFRDRRRDNRAVTHGEAVLRYGWREVATDACGIAGEVAEVLRKAGWPGRAHRCAHPNCP